LVTKFENVLQTLDQRDGVIFLVDIYAGSPFNAASLLSMKKDNWDVITGVNVPMLINVFLERESVGEYLQLVDISKQTARDGIKSLKYSLNNNNTEEDHL
jgi:mannose/fructose-specific phosphotransferase system component IIA